MKSIICVGWSLRDAAEGGEPELHSPRPVESGLAALRLPE